MHIKAYFLQGIIGVKKTTNIMLCTMSDGRITRKCSPKETSGIMQGVWTDNEAQHIIAVIIRMTCCLYFTLTSPVITPAFIPITSVRVV